MEKTEIEKEKLLQKILENKNFQYDELFNFFPRDIWNFIFSLFQKGDINNVLLVSKSFFHFLHSNPPPCLKTISFNFYSKNKIDEKKCASILSFPRFSQLTTLKFNSCKFKEIIITDILNICKYISILRLEWCLLGNKGLKIIAEWMKFNRTLKSLTIWDDKIGIEGAIIFGEFLKTNSSLEFLWISCISKSKDIKIIFKSLKINKTLKELRITGMKIKNKEATYIVKVLKINKSLQYLNFDMVIENIEARCIIKDAQLNTNSKITIIFEK